ncbi:MAG: preprotein translocase subunit YajC [Spirochaetes bacterium]|nr:preprotein translocase subunit YajC [Spirochaetota bacterium]
MNAIARGLSLLQTQAANPTGQMVSTIITFGLVFVVFYFLIIRPQNKKQKDAKKMIEAVKKGDKIVTIGGVHGTVYTVKEGTVVVKVVDDCRIEFSKSAIASVAVVKSEEKLEVLAEKPEVPAEKPEAEKK